MSVRVGWFFLLVFPLISGCAIYSTKSEVVKTIIIEPVVGSETITVANFSVAGRISVKDEDQNFSASFRWHHTAQTEEVILLSPFGQIMAQIESDQVGARLTTSEQKTYYAADVETLTKNILGWRVPLNGLKFWIQGHHAPATVAAKDMDINGQVVAIRQDGWDINYIRYAPIKVSQTILPKVLALNYGKLTLKLVIDSWEFE